MFHQFQPSILSSLFCFTFTFKAVYKGTIFVFQSAGILFPLNIQLKRLAVFSKPASCQYHFGCSTRCSRSFVFLHFGLDRFYTVFFQFLVEARMLGPLEPNFLYLKGTLHSEMSCSALSTPGVSEHQ